MFMSYCMVTHSMMSCEPTGLRLEHLQSKPSGLKQSESLVVPGLLLVTELSDVSCDSTF